MKRAAAQNRNYRVLASETSSWWPDLLDEVAARLLEQGERGATTATLCTLTGRERNTVSAAVTWLQRDQRAFRSGRVAREGPRKHSVVWVAQAAWVRAAPPDQLSLFSDDV